MKALVLVAFLAVAAARPQNFNDDVFRFNNAVGVKEGRSFVAQPVFGREQYAVKQYSAAAPVYTTYATQPAYTKQYAVKQYSAAAPVYSQYAAAPVYSQYAAAPVYSQYAATPVYSKYAAAPVYSQYAAAPVYSKYAAAPVYSQYAVAPVTSVVAKTSEPVLHHHHHQTGIGAARILKYVNEADPAGYYNVAFETENGIAVQERGALTKGASNEEGAVKEGSFSYAGDDGQVYSVSYVADENGFRASGEHLPTPPPIPADILRSLEYNAASNEKYDDQGRRL